MTTELLYILCVGVDEHDSSQESALAVALTPTSLTSSQQAPLEPVATADERKGSLAIGLCKACGGLNQTQTTEGMAQTLLVQFASVTLKGHIAEL